MQSVLVTGASGFLGRHLIEKLKGGAKLVALSRSGIRTDSTESIAVDLSDFESLRAALRDHQFDTVFHLGAESIVGASRVRQTFAANVMGTVNLLEILTESGAKTRLVCASTAALENTAPQLPLPAYTASKRCMETACQSYFFDRGLDIVIARLTNIYGPGDNNLSRIVPGTITSALAGQRPNIRSHLDTRINQIYVQDAIRALLLLADITPETGDNRRFLICNTREETLYEIIECILTQMGRSDLMPLSSAAAPEERPRLTPSRELATSGWNADTPLSTGIAKTIDWYTNNSRFSTLSKETDQEIK